MPVARLEPAGYGWHLSTRIKPWLATLRRVWNKSYAMLKNHPEGK
jgi:hypothetical protein